MQGKTYSERVLELVLSIPPGRVSTYGDIARAAGAGPLAARSITGILSKAAARGVAGIPWHRIVYSDGRIWVSDQHRADRLRLYRKEKIKIDDKDRIIGFDEIRF